MRWFASGVTLAAATLAPMLAFAQEADGFDGYIQSGTCIEPTDDVRVELDGLGDHDIEPYLAKTGTGDETAVLGYYGSPQAPGFGFSAIYTDEFSLVIADEGGAVVACGDILQPDAPEFGEVGLAVVQLLQMDDSGFEGAAVIQRARLERELDIIPTRVQIVLGTEAAAMPPAEPVAGYDGMIQSGTCDAPTDSVRLQLVSRNDHDVNPYLAQMEGSAEPVVTAYYGAPGLPGLGLSAAYTDEGYSVVVTDGEGRDPVACGDILEPESDQFIEAGMAMVRLEAVADSGPHGFAVVERVKLERELDVTPTRVRILIFAPPSEAAT